MTYLISAVTYIFDIFIVSSYLKNMLKHFKKKYSTIYILCLILVEVILYKWTVIIQIQFIFFRGDNSCSQHFDNICSLLFFLKLHKSKNTYCSVFSGSCLTWRIILYFYNYSCQSWHSWHDKQNSVVQHYESRFKSNALFALSYCHHIF